MTAPAYWKTTPLEEMSPQEWELLCDGCAKCCLLKLEDEETGEIAYTRLHCRLLDAKTCQCSDYANRRVHVPDCVKLTPASLEDLVWLPKSCAYKLVQEGKDLPDWHHLVCGDRGRIHETGNSVMGRTVSEDMVCEDDQEDWIFDWEDSEV
jgi:hypothetical protein